MKRTLALLVFCALLIGCAESPAPVPGPTESGGVKIGVLGLKWGNEVLDVDYCVYNFMPRTMSAFIMFEGDCVITKQHSPATLRGILPGGQPCGMFSVEYSFSGHECIGAFSVSLLDHDRIVLDVVSDYAEVSRI